MKHSLSHSQPSNPNLTLRARLSDDLRTVEVAVEPVCNQAIKHQASWSHVDAQVREIDYLLSSSWQTEPNPADEAELACCVRELSSLLFDAAFSDALNVSEGCSLIIEAPLILQRIPWEQLRANGLTLGERFAIGRLVPGIGEPHANVPDRKHRAVHVASVSSTDLIWTAWELPAVRAALRRMAMSSGGRFAPPEPSSGRLTAAEIQRWLARSRWLHYAGHAEAATGGRGWGVEPDTTGPDAPSPAFLTPEDVLAIRVSSPEVVFAHGCGTLQVPEDPDSTLCMADALLQRGTRWLLGTTTPTLDNECRYLVESFYSGIVRGLPIGEAVRQARIEATRRCPTGEARWLSYVLYGNPSECFVASRAPATSARRGDCQAQATRNTHAHAEHREQPARTNLPASDAVLDAGTTDRNQPAVAEERAATASGGSVVSPSAPEAGRPTEPLEQPESPTPAASVSSNQMLHFQKQLLASIAGFQEYRDFRNGHVIPARLDEYRATRSSAWTFESFGELRSAKSQTSSAQNRWRYDLQGDSDTGSLPNVRFTVDWIEPPPADGDSAIAPTSAVQVDSYLAASVPDDGSISDRHDIQVIASATGFDQSTVTRFCDESSRRNLRPGLSVVLMDLRMSTVYYRATDLDLMPFLPLFDLSDEERSVQQVAEYVGRQLPLAASLGARIVATDLQLPSRIVAAGFRVAASKYGLSLDDLPQHGLVLSEGTGPATDASQANGDGSQNHERSKWLGPLLAWLTSLAAFCTSLTET